jgi:crotonobetainyl-CoA:carnitine CoA-transferase CaiB-like acyl-CoA transferase
VGIRVLAVEQFGAGPFGTMQLADLGADVIKIEDPSTGGDVSRYVPPFQEGSDSLFFEAFNRNKRSIALDLKHPEGRALFEDLVRRSDGVLSNLRGDQPERLGLRYSDLRTVNPRVVCVSLSGFGMTGPRSAERGYDYTVQGLAGWMSLTGGPEEPPTKSGLSLVDFCAGYVAALALLAGVREAARTGTGCDADLSLWETALAQLTYVGTWVASGDFRPRRLARSAHQSMVPFQTYPTADGWLVIACPKQSLWQRLCAALGRPELEHDSRFADFAARARNRDELNRILEAEFGRRRTGEWLAVLGEWGVPCAAVNDVRQALDDPQARARRDVVEYEHPTLGTVRGPASPFRLSSMEQAPPARGPFLGEHTAEILRDLLRYDEDRIASLRASGALGATESREVA